MANDIMAPIGRRCLREPIPEIFDAATLLKQAVSAHLAGERKAAERLLVEADLLAVRTWVAPLMGSTTQFPERASIVQFRKVHDAPPLLPKAKRDPGRMPSAAEKAKLVERYGYNCAFCGIPLVRAEVRRVLTAAYPEAAYWGAKCHAALWCMWLQFDHLLPHSRGGTNAMENLIVTCAGCNYGRMSHTLEEIGVRHPAAEPVKTDWTGLEELLA